MDIDVAFFYLSEIQNFNFLYLFLKNLKKISKNTY